ncbi:MAG: hypothetical protein WC654_02800 [Patescibacteria group bacterium]
MSRSLEHLRKQFKRLKQSRAQVAAAQAGFWRALQTKKFNFDRAERAQRRLASARQELQRAFDEGMVLLNGNAAQFVRQHKDEPAALERVLGAELVNRADSLRRQWERGLKRKMD